MPANIDSHLGQHAHALLLRSQRASILAANLANADTPNYKAKDVDFASVLKQTQSGQGFGMQTTHHTHLTQPRDTPLDPAQIQYRVPQQASLNGNTVESHIEHGKFSENTVQYLTTLEFLNSKINGLMKALRGE
ncbi:MAG: flagellar basal body rod protein FlgB [Thiotrichales bacterium]